MKALRLILWSVAFAIFAPAMASDVTTVVPKAAHPLLPVAAAEIDRAWPAMPMRSYLGALVEKETCITLTHRYCWSTTARLKTAREEGAGLGQLTRAYTSDGRLRFDALEQAKQLDPIGLADLGWHNVYSRADLNLRAMVLMLRDCDRRLQQLTSVDAYNRVAMCDAAYNGGMGGLMADRRLCAITPKCDPQRWFGHVELYSTKSRTKWQGYGQSAFDINRGHVHHTLVLRRPKYVPLLGD
ncbi:MAG: lytic murein transglycosylase [Rhizobacter sp.]